MPAPDAAAPTVCAMSIVEVHLVEGLHTPAQHAALLRAVSVRYADVLDVVPDQVRAHLTLHRPEHWATAGEPASARSAPYVTAVVPEDRPPQQRRRLLAALTDLLVDLLGVDRGLVQGRIIPVHPDDWAVGGVPAGGRRTDLATGPARR